MTSGVILKSGVISGWKSQIHVGRSKLGSRSNPVLFLFRSSSFKTERSWFCVCFRVSTVVEEKKIYPFIPPYKRVNFLISWDFFSFQNKPNKKKKIEQERKLLVLCFFLEWFFFWCLRKRAKQIIEFFVFFSYFKKKIQELFFQIKVLRVEKKKKFKNFFPEPSFLFWKLATDLWLYWNPWIRIEKKTLSEKLGGEKKKQKKYILGLR